MNKPMVHDTKIWCSFYIRRVSCDASSLHLAKVDPTHVKLGRSFLINGINTLFN